MDCGIFHPVCFKKNIKILTDCFQNFFFISDLVYVILFPQLVCVVHYKEYCNTYGSLAAYIVGFLLRALGGEDILNLPPFIKYPWYDEIDGQLFPFRTFAMLSSLITLLSVSSLSKRIFESGWLPPEFDIFHCVINIPDDVHVVHEPHEEMTVLSASQVFYYQTSEMNGRVNQALDTGEDDPTGNNNNNNNISGGNSSEKLLNKTTINQSTKPLAEERLIRERKSITSSIDYDKPPKLSNQVMESFRRQHSISCSNEAKQMPNMESINSGQVVITKL